MIINHILPLSDQISFRISFWLNILSYIFSLPQPDQKWQTGKCSCYNETQAQTSGHKLNPLTHSLSELALGPTELVYNDDDDNGNSPHKEKHLLSLMLERRHRQHSVYLPIWCIATALHWLHSSFIHLCAAIKLGTHPVCCIHRKQRGFN